MDDGSTTWRIIAAETIPMRSLYNDADYPARPCIYLIRLTGILLYVGRTRQTINARIRGHLQEPSSVGRAIADDIGFVRDNGGPFGLVRTIVTRPERLNRWSVDVKVIDGQLTSAEHYHIATYAPVLNVQR